MSYSVETIKIDTIYTGDILSATVSGSHSVDLSQANIFVLNLSGDTTLNYSNPKQSGYNFLIKAGTHSLTLGTSSNFKTPDGDNITLTGNSVLSGIYDGVDMWVSPQENYDNI
jgi:archaellin